MRIIEPDDNAYIDYLAAKERGVSSTIRPMSQYVEVESLVTLYTGPPAHIFWSRDFDDNELRGWAVPYATLDRRRTSSVGPLGLGDPGLTYVSFAQGIGSARSWLRGANIIGPAGFGQRRFIYNNPIETMLATPRFALNLTVIGIPIPTLRNLVIFIGCEFLNLEQINIIKAFFPGVNIVICYYRSWTGLISTINAQAVTIDNQVGLPLADVQVQIGGRLSQILVSGPNMDGIRMLSAAGEVNYAGQWVPTRNRGSIGAGGTLIVPGYVA